MMGASTILRLGWSDPVTGAFGAHPRLGGPLDLNDGVTFTLLDGALLLEPPPRELALAGNPRTQGERGLRARFRHNRRASAQLILGPMASASDLAAELRELASWLNAAPAQPIALQWQPPNAASPVYLDIVGAAMSAAPDEMDWLRAQAEPITIVFSARPGLRGDRVWLQNLVMNPGFEAPSGAGVTVFNDPLANTNAYTHLAGSPPTVSGGQMTLLAAAGVSFGSPAWSAINLWQVRFRFATNLQAIFDLHYLDANNKLQVVVTASALTLNQVVGGTTHPLGTVALSPALTTGSFYWAQITQFPTAPGNPPLIQAALLADSSGAVGAQLAAVGPYATWDAVTALAGPLALEAVGATLVVGGAFANVQTVALFGPGGWVAAGNEGGATAQSACAWEQNVANTYPGGPTTSFGAARLDLAPAGTVDCDWRSYNGGSPTTAMSNGAGIIPVAALNDVLQAAVWVKSSGLSAAATIALQLKQYDNSGAQLATTILQTVTGNQASWVKLAGNAVCDASGVAYASVVVRVTDTSAAGASANGIVWIDNCQVWDQMATGMASMPYCELRFSQSPAQLLVSGLLGDLPAPAATLLGTYLASWPLASSLNWALARRVGASASATLVGDSVGFQASDTGGTAPIIGATLDSASHGGYYLTTTLNSSGFNPRGLSFIPADTLGTYHLFGRFWSAQTLANLPNVQSRAVAQQRAQPWFGASDLSDQTGEYNGPWSAPLAAPSTWTLADSGQINVPALPSGALTDLAQGYLTPRAQWSDSSASSAAFRAGWQALLPIDGSLLLGQANNPANGPFGVTSSWLWLYVDGLLTNRGAAADGAAATLSIESRALPNPARGAGGPGSQTSGAISVNSGGDPYLTLDPTTICPPAANGQGAGVNQLVGLLTDGAGAVLSVACDLIYTPLYLYPR